MRTVLVWREDLGLPQESFVIESVRWLTDWRVVFAGFRIHDGSKLGEFRTLIPPGARLRKPQVVRYRVVGPPRDFLRALSQLTPSIILPHFGPDAVSALPIARALDLPLVSLHHGYDITTPDAELQSMAARSKRYVQQRPALQREGAAFLAVSNYLRNKMVAQGFPEARTQTHYLGVDTSVFYPGHFHTLSEVPTVTFVGRFISLKGGDLFIRTVAKVQRSLQRPVRAVMVGSGPEERSWRALAASLDVDVDWLGPLSRADVAEVLRSSQVSVVPSRPHGGREEGAGLVALEATACGVPVVAARSGGLPEFVESGVNGFTFTPDSLNECTERVVQLISEPQLARSMGEAGAQLTRRRFDSRDRGDALSAILRQVSA